MKVVKKQKMIVFLKTLHHIPFSAFDRVQETYIDANGIKRKRDIEDDRFPGGYRLERYSTEKHQKFEKWFAAGMIVPYDEAPKDIQERAEKEEKDYAKEWAEIERYDDPNTRIIKKNASKRITEIICELVEQDI